MTNFHNQIEEFNYHLSDIMKHNKIKLREIDNKSLQPEDIIKNIRDNIQKKEIILRKFYNISLQHNSINNKVDTLIKPIEFILTYTNEINKTKKEHELMKAIDTFKYDYLNECLKVESIIYLYNEPKYKKIKDEINHQINIFTSMVNSQLLYFTQDYLNEGISEFIQSLISTLNDILLFLLIKIIICKYDIIDSDKDFYKYFKKDLEKDLEKDFRSCVGFLCWFLTMD